MSCIPVPSGSRSTQDEISGQPNAQTAWLLRAQIQHYLDPPVPCPAARIVASVRVLVGRHRFGLPHSLDSSHWNIRAFQGRCRTSPQRRSSGRPRRLSGAGSEKGCANGGQSSWIGFHVLHEIARRRRGLRHAREFFGCVKIQRQWDAFGGKRICCALAAVNLILDARSVDQGDFLWLLSLDMDRKAMLSP
jgi:hypothetical protein